MQPEIRVFNVIFTQNPTVGEVFSGSNVLQRDCYVILLLAPSQAETTKSARQLEAQLLLLLCSAQS